VRKLILAAALLVEASLAFATCPKYPDGWPIEHWERAREITRQKFDGRLPSYAEAMYARIIAGAELCEENFITFREFSARIAAAIEDAKRRPQLRRLSFIATSRAVFMFI
jgi:hypothetical protein